jgi:hypothetical protein
MVIAFTAAGLAWGTSPATADPAPRSPATQTTAAAVPALCYANSCYGEDPDATGCSSDARTIYNAPDASGPRVQLRYSPTCRAAWARAIDAETGVQFWVYNRDNGQTQSNRFYSQSAHTRMVNDAGTESHACFYLYGIKQCTPYY